MENSDLTGEKDQSDFSKILQTIIELNDACDQTVSDEGNSNEKIKINVFSVLQQAYLTLCQELQVPERQIESSALEVLQRQRKQDKVLRLDQTLGNKPENSKISLYVKQNRKANRNTEREDDSGDDLLDDQNSSPHRDVKLQSQESLKVDLFHTSIKRKALESGVSPMGPIVYQFFFLKEMIKESVDLLDVNKITALHKANNKFDRQNFDEVQKQKKMYFQKFRKYEEIIIYTEKYGYGFRKVKKHVKQKMDGNFYQHAVVTIAKIFYRLIEKYFVFFTDPKAGFSHRSDIDMIAYNVFNLPDFFPTQSMKANFFKLLKVIFQIEEPLPALKNPQIVELYRQLLENVKEKKKNPQKFKNEYMVKLENPIYCNVKAEFREQKQEETLQKKKAGLYTLGRPSKLKKQVIQFEKVLDQIEDRKDKVKYEDRSDFQDESSSDSDGYYDEQ